MSTTPINTTNLDKVINEMPGDMDRLVAVVKAQRTLLASTITSVQSNATLTGQVQTGLANLTAAVQTADDSINALNALQGTDIDTLKTKVTLIQSTDLGAIETLKSDLSAAKASITQLGNDLTAATAAATAQAAAIEALTVAFNDLTAVLAGEADGVDASL